MSLKPPTAPAVSLALPPGDESSKTFRRPIGSFRWLVDFVREGLLDRRAEPAHFRELVPQFLPSGRPPLQFQFETLRP